MSKKSNPANSGIIVGYKYDEELRWEEDID